MWVVLYTTLTALSYVNWITITGPSTITAEAGTVTYSLLANPGSAARSGNIQVGDKVFTVNQAGNGQTARSA